MQGTRQLHTSRDAPQPRPLLLRKQALLLTNQALPLTDQVPLHKAADDKLNSFPRPLLPANQGLLDGTRSRRFRIAATQASGSLRTAVQRV